jgi:hypothetical protein
VDDGDGGLSDVGLYTAIALDANEVPHICYFDKTNKRIKYAYYDKDISKWITSVIQENSSGYFLSMVLDKDGYAHISYIGGGDLVGMPPSLFYLLVYNGAAVSSPQMVDGAAVVSSKAVQQGGGLVGTNINFQTSIKLDSSNNPHIAYYHASRGDLRYASFLPEKNQWKIETVEYMPVKGEVMNVSISNNQYVATLKHNSTAGKDDTKIYKNGALINSDQYEFLSTARIMLTSDVYDPSTVFTIDYISSDSSDEDEGQFASLAIDRDDRPHISYLDADNWNLKYAFKDNSGWNVHTVDSFGAVGMGTSISFDYWWNPTIAYFDSDNNDLKVAFFRASKWDIFRVDTKGWTGLDPCVARSVNGVVGISYVDNAINALKFSFINWL